VLVAIDDLQWLDEATAAVLLYALRRLGPEPVRLLATCRGDPGGELPFGLNRAIDEERLGRLAVAGLSEGAIRRLLRLRFGLTLTRVELHALHEAVGGNPFYTLELVRSGLTTDVTGTVHIPTCVQALAGARPPSTGSASRARPTSRGTACTRFTRLCADDRSRPATRAARAATARGSSATSRGSPRSSAGGPLTGGPPGAAVRRAS
jgi:hypothetical protein